MIRLESFYPFRQWLRITQEFHDDRATVKLKSITFEREFEFEYKDVAEISDAFIVKTDQMSFSFWLLLLESVLISYFCNYLYTHSMLLQISRVLFLLTIALLISSFKRTWRILLSDRNDNLLAGIDKTSRNREQITQIMELIRNNSKKPLEFSVTNPFPEQKPIFEQIEYDFSNLSKTIERFYDDEITGWQKGFYSENVYNIRYERLTNRVHRGKTNNDITGNVLVFCGAILFTLVGLYFLFNLGSAKLIIYLVCIFAGLFIVSIPFSFFKRETVGLYNAEGKIQYWTYVNRKNKAYIERIIEFIRSKFPAEENR